MKDGPGSPARANVRGSGTSGGYQWPVVLVRAPRGIFNQEPPLYPGPVVAAATRRLPGLADVLVPDVNHYTILLTERGARAVADVVRQRLAMD